MARVKEVITLADLPAYLRRYGLRVERMTWGSGGLPEVWTEKAEGPAQRLVQVVVLEAAA